MSMSLSPGAQQGVLRGYIDAWERFWFTPRLPHTLAVLRILTGAMLLYSHLVLATDLTAFLGDHAWINNETARQLHDGAFGFSDFGRSYLWYISSPWILWLHHVFTMLVTLCFAVGLFTRITAPLAWFLQLMYLHRMIGTLFGFDQIVTYSAMYLMLAPCGSCFSVDGWLRTKWSERRSQDRRLQWLLPDATPSVAANVATRLFQLHLCVIYMFGGLAKARGQSWWDGTALWYSVGNFEYQSLDMTWIANYPRLFTAMTHATLFWEIFYCALIWPRKTRPVMLAGAVAIHGGIALFLGMITFGVMMIAANLIFIRPEALMRIRTPREATSESSDADEPRDSWEDDVEAESEIESDDVDGFAELDLEELGLADVSLESHSGDLLGPGVDPSASSSGILSNLPDREASLSRREQRLRDANQSLDAKKQRLKEQLDKYNERVSRLKEREAKIKRLVERRRKAKVQKQDESHNDDPAN